MILTDRIYGTVPISDRVLQDLIASEAMQRLKGVLQHGISAQLGITAPTTRYEHSLGVLALVRRMGAKQPEQIAALLHDVSHTASSHVIDYVLGDHDEQSYHDRVKTTYVARTDVPAILQGHGYNWRDFMDESAYSLLEQPAPALCADRLDYFLRDSLDLKLATLDEIQQVLSKLTVYQGQIVVTDQTAARWMAYTYIAADEMSWSNFREVGLYELYAQAIRLGMAQEMLNQMDFWGSDDWLWQRLNDSTNKKLRAQLALVSPGTRFVRDDTAPDFHVSTKIRTIDPGVMLDDDHVQPLSALDAEFAAYRDAYVERKTGKWPIKVIAPPSADGDNRPASSLAQKLTAD